MRKLGVLTLFYNRDGSFDKGEFDPEPFAVEAETKLSQQVAVSDNHAQSILAQWFEQQNQVELADQDKYEIKFLRSEVSYYAGGIQERRVVLNVCFSEKANLVAN